MQSHPRFWKQPAFWFLILLTFSFALRLMFVFTHRAELTSDPDAYWKLAINLHQYSSYAFEKNGRSTAFRPPLYPLLLTVILKLKGGSFALGILQALLGTITVGLTVLLTDQLLLQLSERRLTARSVEHHVHSSFRKDIKNQQEQNRNQHWLLPWLAGGLVAFDPLLIRYSSQPMTETLCTTLVTAFLYVMLREDDARKAFSWKRSLLAGVLLGLIVLCRPSFWAYVMLYLGVLLLRALLKRSGLLPLSKEKSQMVKSFQGESKKHWHRLCWMSLGTMMLTLPWVWRNQHTMGKPILTTTHGGYTLLLGNNSVFHDQVVMQPWGTVWQKQSLENWQSTLEQKLKAEGVTSRDEINRDRWMSRSAWNWISQHPFSFLQCTLFKWLRFWNLVPLGSVKKSLSPELVWLIGLYYIFVLGAFVLTLILRFRVLLQIAFPLLCMIFSHMCVHSFYWSNMRMRAPITPAIACIAILVFYRNSVFSKKAESG